MSATPAESSIEDDEAGTVLLTKELTDRYLEAKESSGLKKQTLRTYRKCLNELYDFLPEGKEIAGKVLADWRDHLKESGYSDSSIRVRMSAANGFLKHQRSAAVRGSDEPEREPPQMQRAEYLKFLEDARRGGSEREYLLIRVLASIDIEVQQLNYITVEACRNGAVELPSGWRIELPESLKTELLKYAKGQGISEGPVFVSRKGNPLDRTYIYRSIRNLAVKTGIDPEKCNPRALHRMYRTEKKARKNEERALINTASQEEL